MTRGRFLIGALVVAAIFGTALGSFAIVRLLEDDDPATAAPPGTATPTLAPGVTATPKPPIPTPPGPDVTPEPGATPDPTQPWWYVPWLNAERGKPLFDGTLAGIRIADGAAGAVYECRSELSFFGPEGAEGSALDVTPSYLPAGSELSFGSVVKCDGLVRTAEARYNVLPDAETGRLGGGLDIIRYRGTPYASLAIPAERWREAEVAGLTVALAEPILPEFGIGPSAVVAYRDGQVTVVRANWIPLAELLKVAEEVLR